ncbi:hypothetical protein TVAG_054560 [Trichomonas vaginalis G3]|uniref:Right handed beta helix domain-containing protein n=1 Tax=Trichomonas vaginalis (strain ATCC PRA-98 / G3) TaxID=412133 RepID=A2EYD1_TRIV3|nr:hypothetical protein TVAGG3_0774070 [Trichomonas vaginalis G3]EAY02358.1 hypothetical protein TVAG_054560 [Trichomonas vaginalis G3]KAI5514030.1 hypothetical protein TVAGG3_0774070 [Trichomonas vaginalis G3]|eukprot:XP_001330625.1 hypothetical protein [Trichomonas vaginalis G3]
MNTSNHKITTYAAYVITDPTETGIINFTTASNTSSTEVGSLFNSRFNITKCNYLNNELTGSNNAIISCSSSSTTFLNCSFIGNKGNYLFDVKPNIVDNCYFNENNVTQTVRYNSVSFKSIQPFDFNISHYSTYYCPATYFYYNPPNLDKNKKDSRKKFKEDELDLKDINFIINKVYKTSFVEAVNFSTLT